MCKLVKKIKQLFILADSNLRQIDQRLRDETDKHIEKLTEE